MKVNEVSEMTEIEQFKVRVKHIQEHIQELNKDLADFALLGNEKEHFWAMCSLNPLNNAYNSTIKVNEFLLGNTEKE